MKPLPEALEDGRQWLRVADPQWADPLETRYAYEYGGRWNRPRTRHTLYLCADESTARAQIQRLIADRFVTPEDLRDDFAVLIPVQLPAGQTVADIHTPPGITAVGLPRTYPRADDGSEIPRSRCQRIGDVVADHQLSGVHARSATATATTQDTELAWFRAEGETARQSGEPKFYGSWR